MPCPHTCSLCLLALSSQSTDRPPPFPVTVIAYSQSLCRTSCLPSMHPTPHSLTHIINSSHSYQCTQKERQHPTPGSSRPSQHTELSDAQRAVPLEARPSCRQTSRGRHVGDERGFIQLEMKVSSACVIVCARYASCSLKQIREW